MLAHLRAVPWRLDQSAFKAWRQGLTGYPLVDAGGLQQPTDLAGPCAYYLCGDVFAGHSHPHIWSAGRKLCYGYHVG